MNLLLASLSTLVFLFSVIPFLKMEGWWIRGFDFPRLQFAILGLALCVADLFFLNLNNYWELGATVLCTAAVVIQAWWILPYTAIWKKEVMDSRDQGSAESIAIMTANVLQTNRNYQKFIDLVRENRPDILVALETDKEWQKRLDTLVSKDGYNYSITQAQSNLYGMVVYSRLPLENSKTQFLVEEDVPSIHALARLPSGQGIRIHFIHPAPPSPTENQESSERDAELAIVGKSAAKATEPTIVTGDLNDVAWSATTRLFRQASGLRDIRIGRKMLNTFHAEHWYLRWPLDHLFCSDHFELAEVRRLPKFGSDHFSLLAKLILAKPESQKANPLKADEDEKERVKEKMEDENVTPQAVHNPEK